MKYDWKIYSVQPGFWTSEEADNKKLCDRVMELEDLGWEIFAVVPWDIICRRPRKDS